MQLPADALEPIILADGTRIDPTTGKRMKDGSPDPTKFIEVPNAQQAQALIVKTRKSVADLPMPPAQLSGVALVAFYTLFGLADKEIAVALEGKLTVDQVRAIKKLDAYLEFMATAKTNIIETATDQVRDIFQQHAASAANKIVGLAQDGDGVLAFKASQDILDRAGHRPVDIVEHKHNVDGGLNIVIKRASEQVAPMIDVTPNEVSYADLS